MSNDKTTLELRNLTISYPKEDDREKKNIIYRHFSYRFESGIYTFTGESGCGKSTLMRTIIGLKAQDEGEIFLNEAPVKKYDPDTQMVHQSYEDVPWRTVYGNMKLAYELRHIRINKEVKEEIDSILEAFGLLDQKNKKTGDFASEISGGQSQRLSIAVSLAAKPKLLLMDEPTSALDKNNTENVAKILKAYQKETNCIIIVITHDVSFPGLLGAKDINLTKSVRIRE